MAEESAVVSRHVDGVDECCGLFELVDPALAELHGDEAGDVEDVKGDVVPGEAEFFDGAEGFVEADDVGFRGEVVGRGDAVDFLRKVGRVLGEVDFEVFEEEVGELRGVPDVGDGVGGGVGDGVWGDGFDFVEENGEVLIEGLVEVDACVFEEVDDGVLE